jgi:hypothetical protein
MPKVTIFCDQRFLKPVSAIARVLRQYADFDTESAERISLECARKKPISLEISNYETARVLVENLREIGTVNAEIEPQE